MKKICTICGKEKDVNKFHKVKGGIYGVRKTCKECRKIETKTYYKINKNIMLEKTKEYQKSEIGREKHLKANREYQKRLEEMNPFAACKRCNELYPIKSYGRSKEENSRRSLYCDNCQKLNKKEYDERQLTRAKDYYRNNKKEVCERAKIYYKDNPEKHIISRIRLKCKKNNIPFNLSIEDIVIPDRCPILDIPFEISSQKINWRNSPSVDRIIPKLGYVKGNIQIISVKANTMKSDATFEEIEKLYFHMKKILNK